MEHDVEKKQENGEARIPVGYKSVDHVGGMISVALVAHLESRLVECTMDNAVLCIHDGCLGILLHFLLYALGFLVAYGDDLCPVGQFAHNLRRLGVHFKEFDG